MSLISSPHHVVLQYSGHRTFFCRPLITSLPAGGSAWVCQGRLPGGRRPQSGKKVKPVTNPWPLHQNTKTHSSKIKKRRKKSVATMNMSTASVVGELQLGNYLQDPHQALLYLWGIFPLGEATSKIGTSCFLDFHLSFPTPPKKQNIV